MGQKFSGKPGDLIEINRGSYQHWAVYIGGQEVVHLVREGGNSSGSSANLGSSSGKVKREKFTDVVGSDRYKINNLLDNSCKAHDPSIIVKEACAMVGRELQYNVVTYNSEHFATEMRYGKFNGKPGDMIEISRGSYQHWAVYIGGQMVVHLVKDGGWLPGLWELLSISNGKVKIEKFNNVVGSDHCQVNNLLDKTFKARDPSIIVKEACEMVGRELKYGVVSYNSKHFATDLRYGKAESRQFKGKPGDLIEINRGSYQHWAVYIGGQEVVHLVPEGGWLPGLWELLSRSNGNVKIEKFNDVVGSDHCQVNNLLDKTFEARDPSIIVMEAYVKLGHKLPYHSVSYNSEHFATDLRYGVPESRQFNGKPGDLIEISSGSYQHWAVYIGGQMVVHLVTEGGWLLTAKAKVKHEKLADVAAIPHCKVNNLLDDMYKARDPSIIVKEACAMVGREPKYDLVNNNCEHFATDLRYGKAESRQFSGKPGDLIEIFEGSILYQHWAVYIGGNEVVHFEPDGGKSASSSDLLCSITGNGFYQSLINVVGHKQVNKLLDGMNQTRECNIIGMDGYAMIRGEHLNYDSAMLRDFLLELISETGKVKRQKLADVVSNYRYQVNNGLDKKYKPRDPSIIVKEALAMVGRELKYNIVTNNCQHFATEMRYDKPVSRQSQEAASIFGVPSVA